MAFQTPNGQLLYRVGDIIITINNNNPSKIYGGTWQLLCPGRTLVCIDTLQSEFDNIKKTGGAMTHVLTEQEMPKHKHETIGKEYNYDGYPTGSIISARYTLQSVYSDRTGWNFKTGYSGNGSSHNNLQPYMTVYMWVRTI